MSDRMDAGVPLVLVERGDLIESRHRGHVVILDARGAPITELGQAHTPMFPRSSNKPLQAVGMLRAGFTPTPPQLALAAASHSGEPMHLAVVRSTLAAAGLSESDLGCPPELPTNDEAAEAILARGGHAEPITMNCSGKHAAMLATSRRNGWGSADYLRPDHPVQQLLKETVADLAGERIDAVGVDGCGAPVFAISLTALARAFLTLANAATGPAHAVTQAMREYPELVGGTGRPVTRLMRGIEGLVAKDGAEGVWAAAIAGVGAVAVKIDDGAMRAADRVVVGALLRLGRADPVLAELAELPLLGGGRPVGRVRLIPELFGC